MTTNIPSEPETQEAERRLFAMEGGSGLTMPGLTTKLKRTRRRIVIDSKEIQNHSLWLEDGPMADSMPGTLRYEGFLAEVSAHQIGDYWIDLLTDDPFDPSSSLIIESKTWADLIGSVRDSGEGRADSRMRHQLQGLISMRARGYQVAVLLVGIVTLPSAKAKASRKSKGVYVWDGNRRSERPWSYYELEQIRGAIQRLGVMTYQAPSENDVPRSLKMLAELCERSEHFGDPGLPAVASLAPKLGFLATQLTGVQGIGPSLARVVAARYGTFARFYEQASVVDLQKVPDVGKVLASRIHAAFHDMEKDQQVGMGDGEAA